MKIAKKVLVGVLTLAMLISCFMVFASAEDPYFDYNAEYAEGTYSSILEYYEQNFGVDFNIDGTAVGADYPEDDTIFVQNGSTVKIAEESGNKYVAISGPQNKESAYANAFLRWTAERDLTGAILNFDISAAILELPGGVTVKCTQRGCKYKYDPNDPVPEHGGTCPNGHTGKLSVVVSDSIIRTPVARVLLSSEVETAPAEANTKGFELFVLDSKNDRFSYGIINGEGEFEYVTPLDSEFNYDPTAWYNVSVTYSTFTKTYSFTITNKADPTNTLTKTALAADLDAVRTLKIGSSAVLHENNDTVVKLDNLTAQGGSFDRTAKDKQAVSDEYVTYFGRDIGIVGADDQAKIIDVYSRMVSRGYVPSSADAVSAVRSIATTALGVVESYVSAIDATAPYLGRSIAYDTYSVFITALPSDDALTGYSAEEVTRFVNANNACAAEKAVITTLKNDSLFIADELASFDSDSEDYGYLRPIYDAIKDKKYDATVPGAESVGSDFRALTVDFPLNMAKADAFVDNVIAARVDDTVAFGERYLAYAAAKDGYFDNETYPGVADALIDYTALVGHYTPYELHNDKYIKLVYDASIGEYINSISGLLAQAYSMFAPEENAPAGQEYHSLFKVDYPGVADAMETYEELKAWADGLYDAARLYVEAVEALAGLEGDALFEGIKVAEELKKAGNVTGAPDVAEANIALDNIKTQFILTDGFSSKFITLVSSIANAKTLYERYILITEALKIDSKYLDDTTEVNAAKAALTSAIAAYNADIAALNAALLGSAQ